MMSGVPGAAADQADAAMMESLKDQRRLPTGRTPSTKPPRRAKSGAAATPFAAAQLLRNAQGRNLLIQKGRIKKV